MPSDIELTIVMPCLNEAETLEACIRKAREYLERSGVEGEIVIGDNGSTDGSQAIAYRLGARVVDVPIRGYGSALYAACAAANGKYIVMADSDDSYDFSDLSPFLDRLREGYDVVMGNRFKGGIKPGAMPWKNRYIGNPALSGIGQLLFHVRLRDFHCGIRGFSKAAFEAMDLRTTGMEFASEMVIKATQRKLRLTEVPTTLSPDGRSRPPHLRPFRDGWRHLRFMLLFSPDWLFLYPGLALMALSLVLGGLLVHGPLVISGVRLDIDTLIYCAFFLLTGFQSVLFSLLSRAFAVGAGLYPPTRRDKMLASFVPLEVGLVSGCSFALVGLCTALYTILVWKHQAFGRLNLDDVARIVIPGATALALGIEIVLFSLFLSTLSLAVRHHDYLKRERSAAPAFGRAA